MRAFPRLILPVLALAGLSALAPAGAADTGPDTGPIYTLEFERRAPLDGLRCTTLAYGNHSRTPGRHVRLVARRIPPGAPDTADRYVSLGLLLVGREGTGETTLCDTQIGQLDGRAGPGRVSDAEIALFAVPGSGEPLPAPGPGLEPLRLTRWQRVPQTVLRH